MKIEKGLVYAHLLEESKRFNAIFEEVQQIDERFVNNALLYSLNCDREYDEMFFKIEIQYAELCLIEDDYKIYGFAYAFSKKTIVKFDFNMDVNDFYRNSFEIRKTYEEV